MFSDWKHKKNRQNDYSYSIQLTILNYILVPNLQCVVWEVEYVHMLYLIHMLEIFINLHMVESMTLIYIACTFDFIRKTDLSLINSNVWILTQLSIHITALTPTSKSGAQPKWVWPNPLIFERSPRIHRFWEI